MAIVPAQNWTIALRTQGAVTMPQQPGPTAIAIVAIPSAPNSSYVCVPSGNFGPASCSYDPIKQALTIVGSPGDIVTWQAWTLTAAP